MKNIICNKNVLDILRSLPDLLFKDIKLPLEFFNVFLIVFGNGKPHDSDFHHLPQFHQIDIILTLMKDDAIYHGVDHDLIKTMTPYTMGSIMILLKPLQTKVPSALRISRMP